MKKWITILLYVAANAPISARRDLWRPPRGFHQGVPSTAEFRRSVPEGLPVFQGERQHLHQPFDISEPHAYPSWWQDLKRPGTPSAAEAARNHPVDGRKSDVQTLEKQRLVAVPKQTYGEDKQAHPYHFHFHGLVQLSGQSFPRASVALKVVTPLKSAIYKTKADAHGAYSFDVGVDGADNQSVLWWLHAESPGYRSEELEGSRIFSHDDPSVVLEKDLALAHT